MNRRLVSSSLLLAAVIAAWLGRSPVRGEVMLQYFNTSWQEITDKMPELAEAGYSSMWLPPPTKGSGGLSVGYDLWDRFDLGSKDQRGSVKTRYGTEAELLKMVETAHRFGIRIYFDNIMNHNAFDVPGYNADTPIDIYPGFLPEDFHLRLTADGFYRKWDNTRDWNSSWQVQNLGLADLIDIAQENPNANFGTTEGSTGQKLSFVRQPNHPEYYPDLDLPITVSTPGGSKTVYPFANKEPFSDTGVGGVTNSAGNRKFDWVDTNSNGQHDAGEASESFTDTGVDPATPGRQTAAWGFGDGRYNMGNPVTEDVNALLIRSARWLMDRTKADGLRLDAVKHVPDYFFGQQSGGNKDYSDAGYCGAVQMQFNLSRGFSDWDNHRDALFDTEKQRDDAMLFGEHLGSPPGYDGYINAGMRLVDNPLRSTLNDKLGNPSNGLNGMDQPGAGGFSASTGVMHAQSHDSDYAARRELQHAFYLTREGLGIIYTDGNYHAGTLSDSGGAFPRHANTAFLGQFGDGRIPNLLYIHNQFARGTQWGRYSDADYVAYERHDGRENGGPASNTVTMVVMVNDNYASGQARSFVTSFPAEGGSTNYNDAYLYNYSSYGGGFYIYASQLGSQVVPPGGYFVFSYRVPEQPLALSGTEHGAIEFIENGQPVGTVTVSRKDGPDGDPNFNPYGLPDTNSADYTYQMQVPRVTALSNLTVVARADGSAANVLVKLDAGVDINSHLGLGPLSGDLRDNPPATVSNVWRSTDLFQGYEQPNTVFRIAEKFAARNTSRNIIGSPGAETYECTIGSTNAFVVNLGPSNAVYNTSSGTAQWAYHDPVDTQPPGSVPQFNPAPGSAAGQPVDVWVKVGYQFMVSKAWLYYTTNGTTYPEGSGGVGVGATQVAELNWVANGAPDGGGTPDWWKATLPALPNGTVLRYKIGVAGTNAAAVFPRGANEVALKRRMESRFEITNLHPANLQVRTHGDYGPVTNGLAEGFHVLRSRAFLKRDGQASLYDTRIQTFYYDAKRPEGEIKFPGADNDTIGGSEYGVVVRAEAGVSEVWYSIVDGDSQNDDANTGFPNGNGATNWVKASEVEPNSFVSSVYPREFRFTYRNIPPTGTATIRVRLRELSSAASPAFTGTVSGADDAANHYTTLTRTVNTAGENVAMFIAWPQNDGDVVGTNYVMKVWFTKSLANGLTTPQLISRFQIGIASTTTGSTNGAVLQPQSAFAVNYDINGTYHELAYLLPNLYNGDPDFLHAIVATHTRGTQFVTLASTRLVRAYPVVTPRISIVNPVELGSDGRPYEIVLPAVASPTPDQRRYTVRVETSTNVVGVTLGFTNGTTGLVGAPVVTTNGASLFWEFPWTNLVAGTFTLVAGADVNGDSTPEATALRNATVVLRQLVTENGADGDDDDDGLSDTAESTITPLPVTNPETWNNGDVHVHYAYGFSNPLSPDTDGDGLPDGLEVGWRVADTNMTSLAADTDGNGEPNFVPDLDPPFFNTVPDNSGVPNYNFNGSRDQMIAGSMTNPSSPDTDGDGILDGLEDRNHNGWTDGDGASLGPTQAYNTRTAWPNHKIDVGETWTETDPTVADSDADGLSDGYGEDKDFNGLVTGDANTNFVYDAGEAWTETNPRAVDTDGDGLPDGWEVQYSLDPLDNGTNSLRTATAADGVAANGAAGNPDGDSASNLQEFLNGTNPRVNDNVPPPTSTNSLTIGGGVVVGTNAGVTWNEEFQDWNRSDLKALDEYDGNGSNKRNRDVYPLNDGYDSSRDLVAFYARDGGLDGKYYFRVDVQDLTYQAEQGYLDVYVVIDTGNPSVGEIDLPDQVDGKTDMRWEVVVAAFSANNGSVYVKTPGSPTGSGVTVRGYTPNGNGFLGSYYRSDLDAVEFAISRQALLDAGWNGASPLQFQVFTTKDGTQNSPLGPGDIGGRIDLTDTIYDDDITESDNPSHTDATLHYWFTSLHNGAFNLSSYPTGLSTSQRPNTVKVVAAFTGNQAVQNADAIQDKIRDTNTLTPAGVSASLDPGGNPTGYARLLETAETFRVPLSLHLSGTLVSALQWAESDPALDPARLRSGPGFNGRIRGLVASNLVTLGSGFYGSHIAPYFTGAVNRAAVLLQDDVLRRVFGSNSVSSASVLWTGERTLDGASLSDLAASSGHTAVVLDQMTHLWWWGEQLYGQNQGRQVAISDAGYQLNRFNGMTTFLISGASDQLYVNQDLGVSTILRELLNRKAMAGSRDQVIILSDNWEAAGGQGGTRNPDRLNLNLRWLANKPWVQLTTMERINAGEVDVNNDGVVNGSDTWYVNDRGTAAFNNMPKDFVRHASGLSYDNWFNGSALEESFTNRFPFVRSGVPGGIRMGRLGSPGTIVHDAWTNAAAVAGSLSNLARIVYMNGIWETAFHNEDSSNLSKFSTGAYQSPDATFDTLAPFAFNNNARVTRAAGLVAAAGRWAATVASTNTVATSADLDADGEAEYTLSNDRVFAVFERIGGRLVAAFTRDPLSGKVVQAVGNLISAPEGEGEEEGITNLSGTSALALRTSGFKDWFAVGFGAGTQYVNDLYTASSVTNGWQLVSTDGRITKTITLPPGADRLEAAYQLSGGLTKLYVRHGLSPDMADLVVSGQANLRGPTNVAGRVEVANANSNAVTRTALAIGGGGYTNVAWNSAATDRHSSFTTFNMRNQAQTHQVELESLGTNFTFALQLSVQGGDTDADADGLGAYEEELLGTNPNLRDSDGDGMEDQWEKLYRNAAVAQDGDLDTDGDGQSDRMESIAGTNPNDSKEYFRITGITRNPGGQVTVTWSTTWSPQITVPRRFIVLYSDDLSTPFAPLGNTGTNPLSPSGPTTSHTDTNAPALRRNYRVQVITP